MATRLAAMVGMPADSVRLFLSMLSGVLAGAVYRFLPNATAKHLFSIVLALTWTLWIMGMLHVDGLTEFKFTFFFLFLFLVRLKIMLQRCTYSVSL